jgi:hypothetical protein
LSAFGLWSSRRSLCGQVRAPPMMSAISLSWCPASDPKASASRRASAPP